MAKKQNLDFNKLLPSALKNETLTSLVSNLFNRFVSEEKSVLIDGRIGKNTVGDAKIVAPTLDRELNALAPALFFKNGTEDNVNTFSDMLNRLTVLDADIDNLRSWMSEQHFNYTAPISYDKLINYSNYYWIGNAVPNLVAPTWNPSLSPEYYVIRRFQETNSTKAAVRLATTTHINLWANNRPTETFTVTFTAINKFTVTSDLSNDIIVNGVLPGGEAFLADITPGNKTLVTLAATDSDQVPGLQDPNTAADPLCSFYIVNGAATFAAGDSFTIQVTYFTSENYVSFNSPNVINKGAISGITTSTALMWIDGVRLIGGERILVWNQNDSRENGIYRVTLGEKWRRTFDAKLEEHLPNGAQVYVTGGATNAGKTFVLQKTANVPNDSGELVSFLDFSVYSTSLPDPMNDWQKFNFWFHKDDLTSLDLYGLDLAKCVQASRPIIEYSEFIQLNSYVTANGIPTDDGLTLKQVKTRFNQIPQFDLFRYDGTHQNATSGIFFYVEDPDFAVDSILKKRIKLTTNYDYIFGVGLADEMGRQLYYKYNGALKSIWQPGPGSINVNSMKFTGSSAQGEIQFTELKELADNQSWQITATSPTEFSVVGTRSGNVGTATVNQLFECDDFIFTLVSSDAFAIGDKFTFTIAAPIRPRYVKKLQDESIINYPGGIVADKSDEVLDGAWMTPLRMFQNLERETRYEIAFGDFINHARSVLRNQNNFEGTSIGNNNSRTISFDPGLGGTIREFGSNFPLLASMLIQKEISPLTIIDFAEQQYNIALSSIDQFLISELATYLASNIITTTDISPNSDDIIKLETYFEALREQNQNLKDVFNDSTALVKNWPATLPMIGLLPRVVPNVGFDYELGIEIIVHHDGHISPLALRDADFDRNLAKSIVTRSDGTQSAGIFSEAIPNRPYAGQLWLKPSTLELFAFNVISDLDTAPPTGVAGQFWYNRTLNELREWDTVSSTWVLSTSSTASRWIPVNTAAIRNSLILAVENKLYNSVHPSQELNLDISTVAGSQYAEVELARFSAKYNYDMFAPAYDASDAFTWNYSQASIPGINRARWFDIYKDYFNTVDTLPTCRPNLEPWKLLGINDKPNTWDADWAATNQGSSNIAPAVVAISHDNIDTLFGLIEIDGINLTSGDRVLLVGQTLPQFNGIYVVSANGWVRSSDTLVTDLTVPVSSGLTWADSVWSITTAGQIDIGSTAITFEQVRLWIPAMWDFIKQQRPNVKLCVNVNNDALLPPYVSANLTSSSEALLTVIPPGISNGYQFNDNGPVEIVWRKSLEYTYGLVRSYFRLSPLEFLDKSWGETYMSVGDNLRVERNIMQPLSPSKFLMHGERLNIVNSYTAEEAAQRIKVLQGGTLSASGAGVLEFEVTHCADNLTVMYVYSNGTLVGMINVGETIANDNPLFVNNLTLYKVVVSDLGIPFELGEKITVTFDASGTATYAHTAATVKKFKGLGQLFTNLLRYSYIDTDVSPSSLAYRGWELKLSHSIGALIRPDSLSINTALGKLPSTAFNVILKKASNTSSKWISALRIQVVEMGAKKLVENGLYVPVADGADWVFRVETYNAQHPQLEYYEVDTSGEFQTFSILGKEHTSLEWKRYTSIRNKSDEIMPRTIVGIQNVVNFVFGYIDRLQDLGWEVGSGDNPITDALTGRNIDWQLEVEKFIDSVYTGVSVGGGYICNPFMQMMKLNTPIGLMSRYSESNFVDVYSMQAAFDVTGVVIPLDNITVIRTDENTITRSTTPIFSAHVFTDEYEHTILMNKQISTDPNASVIFDSFLGQRIDTAYLNFIRQDATDRKPTFDGFFLSGNNVARNITSSIDMIGSYYDAANTFAEQKTADHALALLGFTRKDYLSNIGINNTTQFNFWRGLISAKGTNMTIDAFANYKKFVNASVDEYWAYKIASFGDDRERSYPEIKINPIDTTQKFTKLQFYSSSDTNYTELPLFSQIEYSDDDRWFSIDDLGIGLKFEAQHISETFTVPSTSTFPVYVRLNNIYHNGDTKAPVISGAPGAIMINSSLARVEQAGTYTVSGYTWINPTKLSPIKLFDYKQQLLVEEIGLWHPAIGIHASNALELVDTISSVNPASYNYTTQITDNPNFRHLKPWAEREVGKVWWDTTNLDYIPYYDATIYPNRDTRHSRWGSLAEWASIDLYEWTESNVHPSEYDALASSQEGNSELDSRERASGTAALKKFYKRDRAIKTRPIAWSQAGAGFAAAHPSFGPAEFTSVFASGNLLVIDKGRAADIGIVADKRFGGWKGGKPVGEVTIVTGIVYDIGSENQISQPVIESNDPSIQSFSIAQMQGGLFGTRIGAIKLSKKQNDQGATSFSLRMSDSTGYFEDVELADWYSSSELDNKKIYKFNNFGLQLTAVSAGVGTITAEQQANAISEELVDIYVREAVRFTEIIPLPDIIFVNDQNDPLYVTSEYEWKCWSVPTQEELSADLLYPNNTWQPYLGDEVTVAPSASLIKEMKDSTNSLTLSSGITINRFASVWLDWTVLTSVRSEIIADGTSISSFTLDEDIDSNRLSIYTNGIQMNPSGYVISGKTVNTVNILSEGTRVTLLYRAYQPTASQLAFDPANGDDVSVQVQYKADYEYTSVDVRDEYGNVVGTKYFFWVQDKTIPQVNKSMSLIQAKTLLKEGPSAYTIFARLVANPSLTDETAAAFDSCAIAGLSSLVSKNDSFKLRFLRDFTLRDDPEEINLKNIHTEWALIRKQQSSKIPESLWNILTDAVCGADSAGNPLPAQVRIDYDAKNGTRTRYGFKTGQIFADTALLRESITNTILNTQLTIQIGNKTLVDYISVLDFNNPESWFADANSARATMTAIWNSARPRQINEIFFNSLDDALVNNYESSDIFKTSLITVNSTTAISEASQQEQLNELY